MTYGVAARRRGLVAPARAFLALAGRVEARARDHDVRVAGLAVDGDPLALARLAPAHEAGGVERLVEQPRAVKRVRHGARAVVARVLEVAVATAVLVRLVGDLVGRGDRLLDLLRRVGRRDGGLAVRGDRGLVAGVGLRRGAHLGAAVAAGVARIVAPRRSALGRGLERASVGRLELAVHAKVLGPLEALDLRRGALAVDAVHGRANAGLGQVPLRDLHVAATVADLQGVVAEARLGGAWNH